MGLSVSFNVDNATLADVQELVAMAERMGISSDTYVSFDDDSRHLRIDSDGLSEKKVAEIREQGAQQQTDDDDGSSTHPRDGGEWSDVFDRVTRSVSSNPMAQHIGDAAMRSLGDILSGRRNPPGNPRSNPPHNSPRR